MSAANFPLPEQNIVRHEAARAPGNDQPTVVQMGGSDESLIEAFRAAISASPVNQPPRAANDR